MWTYVSWKVLTDLGGLLGLRVVGAPGDDLHLSPIFPSGPPYTRDVLGTIGRSF